MKVKNIISYIEEAFDGVPQPKLITLHVAQEHDSYNYDNDEAVRKRDFFGPWQNIPFSHIKNCPNALSYLDEIGMRFYLPVFMVSCLKNFGHSEGFYKEHTLYSLNNYPDNPDLSNYHRKRFLLFNTKQLKACALFVQYCAEDKSDDIDSCFATELYNRYWIQYNK